MDTTLKTIAQQICNAVGVTSDVEVDGCDRKVIGIESFTFECSKFDAPPSRGRTVYTVTVTAKHHPFNDEG